MIRLQGLSKYFPTRYGPRYIFRDLDLDLPGDRDIAILGKNGAGKTTLMNIIGGLEAPSAGRVVSERVISWPLGLATGFQKAMTGRENVRFICRVFGMPASAEVEEFVKDFSEIGDDFELPVGGYSSGMRSRYNFAVSMGFDFDTYLLDEIMAVGDAAFRKKCDATLDEKRESANIIMVSHQEDTIRRHCNAAILLAYGRAEFYESVDRALYRYELL